MIQRDVVPSVKAANLETKDADLQFLAEAVTQLNADLDDIMRLEEEAEVEARAASDIPDLQDIELTPRSKSRTLSKENHVMRRHSRQVEDNPGATSKPKYEICADLDGASTKARQCRLERCRDIRNKIDQMEERCPRSLWTLPAYDDLFFIDQMTGAKGQVA